MQTKKAPVLDFTTTANKDPIGLVRNAQIYIVLCEKGHFIFYNNRQNHK